MGDKHGIRLSEKDFGCINQRMRLLSLFLRRLCKQWSLWRESQVKLMKTTLVTVKQCSNPAEAAFFASYLEDNGVHTVNSAENIVAVSGNNALVWLLSLLSFGLYEPAADPMWVCRNCDWDSHRRMGE